MSLTAMIQCVNSDSVVHEPSHPQKPVPNLFGPKLQRISMRIVMLCMSIFAATAGSAAAQTHGFTTQFSHCSEFAGEGLVRLAVAQKLVPANYTITGAAAGSARIVVRMTHCDGIQVAETPKLPTTISQIGVNIDAPDGTGTINNYVIVYVSNNPFLVRALQLAGAPAQYDPSITYQYTLGGNGTSGVLYGAAPNPGVPAYFLYGPETEPPPNSAQLFIANWWFGSRVVVKEATTLPAISFGTSGVTFYTSKDSVLGALVGGNAYSAFTVLSLHGEYDTGKMIVTATSH
jgi:hypothetical protein